MNASVTHAPDSNSVCGITTQGLTRKFSQSDAEWFSHFEHNSTLTWVGPGNKATTCQCTKFIRLKFIDMFIVITL